MTVRSQTIGRDATGPHQSPDGHPAIYVARVIWFVNLIALETVSVAYTQPTMPSWNQIHIRGYFPEKGATPAALDEALRRVNPQSGGYAGVFAPLDAIRTWAREDVARQLRELAVR